MPQVKSLSEVFGQAAYPVAGHNRRQIQVLQEVFAGLDPEMNTDMYGAGPIIDEFQDKMAAVLGKESSVFFPSGTMAQQIALRIWCDRKGIARVAYHPLSHLEIHEQDGLKKLHHIETVLLADKSRVITLADVQGLSTDIACLLLELPQREIGGQLPSFEELEAISAYCREKGIMLQLDGARLFEILPYYKKTAAEVCALFDSVYISFYKGLGGIAGAILAGPKDFTEESKLWKRRHGGDLINLYPYIMTADYYYEQRVGKMGHYYEGAKALAAHYSACQAVKVRPEVPVSNMFHVHIALPKAQVEEILAQVCEATQVGFSSYVRKVSETSSYYEVSIGDRYFDIPQENLQAAFKQLSKMLGEAVKA